MSIVKFDSDFMDASVVEPSAKVIRPGLSFRFFKRSVDILVSVLLLPGLFFCAAILWVVNRFVNPGPVLFTQERVGKDGVRFKIYKFRSMQGQIGDPRFAPEESDRISILGAFMRDTRVDEVPQILNVLRGEMSLVGPRPEQVSFYQNFEKGIRGYAQRQKVLPGITGLAQLKYGYTSDEKGTARKLKWDLEYIKKLSVRMEIYIMLQTAWFVLGRLLGLRTKTGL